MGFNWPWKKDREEINIADDDWGAPGRACEPLPLVSPHWPGVGRYIGVVDNDSPVYLNGIQGSNIFDYYDRFPWQVRRVYQDELNAMNPRREKSFMELVGDVLEDLNKSIMTEKYQE